MSGQDSDRDPVEGLAEEFVERLRQGQYPSVDEYVAMHPEWSDEIRELFPTIAAVERVKAGGGGSPLGPVCWGPSGPERLGDFRIVREIGRGGMGIVYEAEQESLKRRVAVKVLPKLSLLDPKHVERFHREARTAARLHHTNIVPVFGVGQQDGYHYIVMQLIRGVGLDEILAQVRGNGGAAEASVATADQAMEGSKRQEIGRFATAARAAVSSKFQHPDPQDSAGDESQKSLPAVSQSGAPRTGAQSPQPAPATERVQRHHETKAGGEVELAPSVPRVQAGSRRPGSDHWHRVAEIGIQAADALQNAHAQSTLHRDIKPANLLVDGHGTVWITDFGLAKTNEDETLSHTGDVVGTLRYMAPEQFRGHTDARSDLYSLGLTLYELLTLEPAFDEPDRSSLVWKITHTEPRRPTTLDPSIPRDLETIVLKSIARTPSDRYPSAGNLAADLRAFLEDRPIQARPATPVERLWRWGRRNPLVAGLASAVLVLLLVVAIVSSVGYVQASRAGTRATRATTQAIQALEGEKKQREKAEATTALALEVLDRIYSRLAPGDLVGTSQISVEASDGDEIEIPLQPVLSGQTVALLEELLAFYDRLAAENADNQQLREDTAKAYRRVGTIKRHLGQLEDAEAAYRHALETYQKLDEGASGDAEFRTEIAVIHNELGSIHEAQSKAETARQEHSRALSILESGSSTSSYLSAEVRYELARTYYYLGTTGRPGAERSAAPPLNPPGDVPGQHRPGHHPPGQRAAPPAPGRPPHDSAHRPPPHRRPPPGSHPPGPPGAGRRHRPPVHDPGQMYLDEGPPRPEGTPEHRHYVDSAIQILEELGREYPSEPKYRHLLARCYRDSPPDDLSDEAPFYRLNKATEILEALVEEYPGVAGYRFDLIESYAAPQVCGPSLAPELCPVVEERLRTALELSNGLVAEHPNIPAYEVAQVNIHLKLAEVLRRTGRPEEAEPSLQTALDLQLSLVQTFPDAPSYKLWLATIRRSLALVLQHQNQLPKAQTLLEESVSVLEPLLENERDVPHVRALLAESYLALGNVLARMNRHEEAREASRKARELRPGAF